MYPDTINRRKQKQEISLPRISHAALGALLYTVTLFIFYQRDFINHSTFIAGAAIVLCLTTLFYTAFKLGANKHFADPSLTTPQILASALTMLVVAYLDRSTQIALGPFMLIAFSSGLFRLPMASLVSLSIACLGAYLAMILLRGHQSAYQAGFDVDLMQWLVLMLTLPGMIAIGNHIRQLRKVLNATRYQLEHYEEKAFHDDLTGLYNRRQLQAALDQARLQANAQSMPFCICLIDIDHFKEINDNGGHQVGDTILREFAHLAQESIRDSDIFGRYGGDEFLQILPDTSLKGAVMHAERLRVYAHFLDFQRVLSQRNISVSIGVAQYRNGEKISALIERADMALYRAKQLGRNRVEWENEA
ncbi:MAG TPA: GGDEF domain-containing protein [Burkholderiaceae bacterium]|jgi:diguanylate cyclase (GGDEF)-like protein|nr:GGDEF domain-containing protein [Burkholderiaceae bacterium]